MVLVVTLVISLVIALAIALIVTLIIALIVTAAMGSRVIIFLIAILIVVIRSIRIVTVAAAIGVIRFFLGRFLRRGLGLQGRSSTSLSGNWGQKGKRGHAPPSPPDRFSA